MKTMVLREIAISEDFNFENYNRLLGNFSIRRCNVESPDSLRGIRLLHVSRCIYPRMKLAGYFPTPDRVVRWIPSRRVTRKGEKVVRVRRITADPGFGMTCDPCGNSPPTLHLPRRYRIALLVYLAFERGIWTPRMKLTWTSTLSLTSGR